MAVVLQLCTRRALQVSGALARHGRLRNVHALFNEISRSDPQILNRGGRFPVWVPVDDVLFTHDAISARFSHGVYAGQRLHKLIDDLDSGQVDPGLNDDLILQAVQIGSRYYSLNNRHLYALREHQANCRSTGFVVDARLHVFELCLHCVQVTSRFLLAYSTTNGDGRCECVEIQGRSRRRGVWEGQRRGSKRRRRYRLRS